MQSGTWGSHTVEGGIALSVTEEYNKISIHESGPLYYLKVNNKLLLIYNIIQCILYLFQLGTAVSARGYTSILLHNNRRLSTGAFRPPLLLVSLSVNGVLVDVVVMLLEQCYLLGTVFPYVWNESKMMAYIYFLPLRDVSHEP